MMRCQMKFQLMPMTKDDIPMFKADIQEVFQEGFEDVYGRIDDIVLPEKDIDHSR